MSLSFLVVVSAVLGCLLGVGGAVWWWCLPKARQVAWVFWGVAFLCQIWWVALVGIVFVKFVVLRQDT